MKNLLTRLFNRNFSKTCKPSLLALSIHTFNKESYFAGVIRQNRLDSYTIKH